MRINSNEIIIGNDHNAQRQYFKSKTNDEIKNEGYIENVKDLDIIRFFYVNPNGFGVDTRDKIELLLKHKETYDYNGIFMSSPDRRWSNISRDRLIHNFKGIGTNIQINTSDSKKLNIGEKDWLLGGTISVV